MKKESDRKSFFLIRLIRTQLFFDWFLATLIQMANFFLFFWQERLQNQKELKFKNFEFSQGIKKFFSSLQIGRFLTVSKFESWEINCLFSYKRFNEFRENSRFLFSLASGKSKRSRADFDKWTHASERRKKETRGNFSNDMRLTIDNCHSSFKNSKKYQWWSLNLTFSLKNT